MKYHALFVIFEKAGKFEIVVCCKLYVALCVKMLFMNNLREKTDQIFRPSTVLPKA